MERFDNDESKYTPGNPNPWNSPSSRTPRNPLYYIGRLLSYLVSWAICLAIYSVIILLAGIVGVCVLGAYAKLLDLFGIHVPWLWLSDQS